MEFDWTKGKLSEGLRHYNACEFFEAHEAWEAVWLEATGIQRTFLQALIQIAAALHHHFRGNQEGSISLMQAASRRLESFPDRFGNVLVDTLRADISKWVQLQEPNPGEVLLPPRILPL